MIYLTELLHPDYPASAETKDGRWLPAIPLSLIPAWRDAWEVLWGRAVALKFEREGGSRG